MELLYNSALFSINTITGLAILVVALIAYKFPPKKINNLYGYRTSRSMKSQINWDFAQVYSTKLLIQYNFIYLIIGCLGLFIEMREMIGIIISIASLILCLGLMIYKTEKALKQFEQHENNNRN